MLEDKLSEAYRCHHKLEGHLEEFEVKAKKYEDSVKNQNRKF